MYIPLDEKYTWLPREVTVENERVGGVLESNKIIVIAIRDNKSGMIRPHPISNFIIKKYINKQLGHSTQLRAARIICMFLNYIYTQIEDGEEEYQELEKRGIRALELRHGGNFITYGTYLGRNSDTVGYWEKTLTRFYHFLNEQSLIDSKVNIMSKIIKGKEILISPFSNSVLDVERPVKENDRHMTTLKDFGENRLELAKLFISIAQEYAPEIALGIYFQMFGGLRVGEVVNLTESAVKSQGYRGTDKNSFFLDIDDRQEKLFPDLRNNQYNQVKRVRIQFVIHSQLLNELYNYHRSKLESLKKQKIIVIEDSLFVSYRKGVPISGPNYAKKFKRVKEIFIQKLRELKYYEDVEFLESLPWGTHIGRAIFTNLLIDQGLDLSELRDARGDKSFLSALAYLERRVTKQRIQEMMESISTKIGNDESENNELSEK